ncbi:MAG: polymer-forming cytoskeletal protein [Pseudomonadota bacterium]
MFTKAKGNEPTKSETPPAQNAIRPANSKPGTRAAPSIISADMVIKGSVTSQGEMQIDGVIEGDVQGSSLTIGQTGSIQGEVIAQAVTVRGKVIGSIRARKVELETGSRVEGDIVHATLAIQSNAVFEGQVKHADDPLKSMGNSVATAAPAPAASSPATSAPAPSTPPADDKSSSGKAKSGFG